MGQHHQRHLSLAIGRLYLLHRLDADAAFGGDPGPAGEDARLGHGRPGWHVECVAIAMHHLGPAIDVQGGGRDLAFPHHEMCASQGQVMTGERYARHYSHVGMVGLDGHKMSKSRGNLVFVRALLDDGVPPAAVRLALLAHHYRSDWEWQDADLADAGDRLSRWSRAIAMPAGPNAEAVLQRVRERLTDDLDTAAALRAIDRWADDALAGRGVAPGAPQAIAALCDALLGVVVPLGAAEPGS